MKAAEEPLYDESKGCIKELTTLWSVLKLLVLKARYGMSDATFDVFLSTMIDMCWMIHGSPKTHKSVERRGKVQSGWIRP